MSYSMNGCMMFKFLSVMLLSICSSMMSAQNVDTHLNIKHLGDRQTIVRSEENQKYLLLPIQEKAHEARLYMIVDNDVVKTINVRLAVDSIDYYVPLELSAYQEKGVAFNIQLVDDSAICWQTMKLSDTFDTANREEFRPLYHFTPAYGCASFCKAA